MYRIKKHIKMVNSHSLNNSCINNNPNIGSDPYWPRYDSNLKSYLVGKFCPNTQLFRMQHKSMNK